MDHALAAMRAHVLHQLRARLAADSLRTEAAELRKKLKESEAEADRRLKAMRDDERPASAASKGDAAPIPVVDERVAIWNTATLKKVAGQAAPMERNLQVFLRKHPECEVYIGQNEGEGGEARTRTCCVRAPSASPPSARCCCWRSRTPTSR